ncbi:MAG: hypothetical protein MUC83_08835 [Pirellula sp.]|nr:hypothetical protein [Pirellula sp.]
MSPIGFGIVLLIALSLRVGFLLMHFSNLESLWTDYERNGLKLRLAQALDTLTWLLFAIPFIIALFQFNSLEQPLITTFIGFLGLQLLSRLRTSSFPRTNVPGALSEAKTDLLVHFIMSLVWAAVVTLLVAVYLWWRG